MTEYICGADEAGTGAWCGGFTVCAVVAPVSWGLVGLNDSKQLTARRRAQLYDEIMDCRPFVRPFVEWVSVDELDSMGLRASCVRAFHRAVTRALEVEPTAQVILDGNIRLRGVQHESFPRADATVKAVMAASIIAKVERDRFMETEADSLYPEYGLAESRGYGTKAHKQALDTYGPCPLHRKSFKPIAGYLRGR